MKLKCQLCAHKIYVYIVKNCMLTKQTQMEIGRQEDSYFLIHFCFCPATTIRVSFRVWHTERLFETDHSLS